MKHLGIGTVLILMLLMCAIFPMAAAESPRIALVIGNSEYEHTSRLSNPINDATDVGMALRSIGFDTTVVLDANIGKMEDAVLTFAEKLRRDPESAGIFYYAGHAVQSSGINYLLPIDADIRNENELRRKALSAQEILDFISDARNSFNMVVLDSCRDNPFTGSFRSTQRGLAVTTTAPPETLVVYATDAGHVATDGDGRNSPFTEAFLANVKQSGIDVVIMIRNVMAEVQLKTNQKQRPWKYSSVTSAIQLVPKVTDDLKPVLVATEYTVIFDTQGGGVPEPLTNKVSLNSSYGTLSEVRKIGYSFGGWWTGRGGTGTQINAQTMMTRTEDHFLYAKWAKVSYTITYNLDRGTNSISNPATYTIESPTITLQNPKRIGYRFSGWYADDSFAVKVTEIPSGSSGTKNLYAKWVKDEDMWWIVTVDPEVIVTVDPVLIVMDEPKAIVKTPISSFTYTTINNNEIEITHFIGSETEVVIPENIDGKPVTSIGVFAFYYRSSLTSITIPDSVTSIEDGTFAYCESLVSIKIPDNVTYIGFYAFYHCTRLSSITIGDSVTSIGDCTFLSCYSLTNITIPASVTSIGYEAFSGCSSLASIDVEIGNTTYESVDGVLFNEAQTELIRYPAGITNTSYTTPNTVTYIGYKAFSTCTSLTSITIPDSVTSIGALAFIYCTSLTSITIPNSVSSIGKGVWGHTSLTDIYCEASGKSSGWDTDWNTRCDAEVHWGDGTVPVSVPGVVLGPGMRRIVTFPEVDPIITVEGSFIYEIINGNEIEIRGFIGSETEVVIPYNIDGKPVTSIGAGAFSECFSVTSILIPDSVASIGISAFYYCKSLTSITIPDSVTVIGRGAFVLCKSLPSITIPDSVKSIGKAAFFACTSLSSIIVNAGNTTYESVGGVLFNEAQTVLIRYPQGITNTSYTIPNTVTSIGDSAFSGCDSLTSITIPDSVTIIGDGALNGCSSLISINVEVGNPSYESVDGVLFNEAQTEFIIYPQGITNTSYTIPNTVTSIGDSAFSGCDSLTSITIPDSVTSIGDFAFDGCDSLINITIPTSVTSIGVVAFQNCDSLTSITIPASVTSIGRSVFTSSDSLTDIYCEASSKPAGWNSYWNTECGATVHWGYSDEVELKSPDLDSDSVVNSEKSNQSPSITEIDPAQNTASPPHEQSPWAIEIAFSTVFGIYYGPEILALGGSVGVQRRFSKLFTLGLWGDVFFNEAPPQGGVKFIFGKQNDLKLSLNVGFWPSVGLYIGDFYIDYIFMFLEFGDFDYHGLRVGYVFNF